MPRGGKRGRSPAAGGAAHRDTDEPSSSKSQPSSNEDDEAPLEAVLRRCRAANAVVDSQRGGGGRDTGVVGVYTHIVTDADGQPEVVEGGVKAVAGAFVAALFVLLSTARG